MVTSEGFGLSVDQIYHMLALPEAEEWRDKVGVAGGKEGSAKNTTRLLQVEGWVFKTHAHLAQPDSRQVWHYALQQAEKGAKIAIWNPEKTWFLIEAAELWWPVSATPRMRTLHSLLNTRDRLQAWLRMLRLMQDTWQQHQVFLDANLSNFGFLLNAPDRTYYLDDEVYPLPQPVSLSSVLRNELKQISPELEPEDWEFFLDESPGILKHLFTKPDTYQSFIDGLRWEGMARTSCVAEFIQRLNGTDKVWKAPTKAPQPTAAPEDAAPPAPPPARMVEARVVNEPATTATPISGVQEGYWLVLADIHSNLPAFEAVLEEVKDYPILGHLFLGDVVGYGPHPAECIRLLKRLDNLIVVQGNHDWMVGHEDWPQSSSDRVIQSVRWTASQLTRSEREWLQEMPATTPFLDTYAIHGSLLNENYRFGYIYEMTYTDNLDKAENLGYQTVWYAHSHLAMVYHKLSNGRYDKMGPHHLHLNEVKGNFLINPGSVGQPRDGDRRAAYALYKPTTQEVFFRRVEYDFLSVQQDILATDLPQEYALRLAHGQ
jgi:predicted phosphodiesterase